MSTTLKKTLAGVAALAFLALAFVTPAKADTLSDLTAQLAALQAQIASLTGGSSSCTAFGVSAVVRQGMTGANVVAVQKAVNHTGAATLTTDGSFGPMTKAGVMAAQTKVGAGADGVWGPNTQAKYVAWVNSSCMSSDDDDDTPNNNGPLQGDAGALNDADFVSSLNNEEVGEGQEDIAVIGMNLEADDGSDLRLTSVRVEFDQTAGQASSDDLDDYAEEVTVWFEGEQVGSADVEDMSENSGVWSKSISLDNSAVIEAGEEAELTVAVTALNGIDSDDLRSDGGTKGGWDVSIANVRYEDGDGVVTTESTLGDIGTVDGSDFRGFHFDSFLAAGDVELNLEEADNNPDAMAIEANENGDTPNVLLLAAELTAEGADVDLNEMTVSIDPNGTGDAVDIASQFILVVDGEEFSMDSSDCDDATCTGTEEYTFDDIDMTISEGETIDVEVRADINEIDGSTVVGGDNLTASIDNADTDAEADGDTLTTELDGTVNGNAIAFYESGILVESTGNDQEKNALEGADNDTADYTINFEVTAFGEDVYLDKTFTATSSTSSTPSAGNRYLLVQSDLATRTGAGATLSANNDESGCDSVDELTNTFKIDQGDTGCFSFTVSTAADQQGSTRAVLYGLMWSDDDTIDQATAEFVYNFDMGVNGPYKTGYVLIND